MLISDKNNNFFQKNKWWEFRMGKMLEIIQQTFAGIAAQNCCACNRRLNK